jgi:hypothetical protein
MAVDPEFLERFVQETDLLRKLQAAVTRAIDKADKQIAEMRQGSSMEEVFGPVPPKPKSPADYGHGD